MKRFMAFILAFVMIMGSVASAAPGDIIHTGNKKVYKPDSQSLVDDIINGADVKQFYREVESNDGSRKFINMVAEEKEQFAYIEQLMKDNNLTSPEKLAAYLESNKDAIDTELKKITNSTAKDFDMIPGGGSLDDYFGSSKSPLLKSPDNYSTPVPGYSDGTTKIVNLKLPDGASSWIYKVGKGEFSDLEVDTLVEGTKYNSGTDIEVEAGKHLLLAAVDSAGKLKAYTSIEILDSMIKKPRVKVNPDSSINPTLSPALNHSGATKVSGVLGEGSWNLAILSKLPEIVYEDSKFTEFKKYEDGMEIIVATDNEVDNGLEGFQKYIVIYEEKDEKIIKYNTLEIKKDKVSGTFDAPNLKVEDNYSTPTPGSSAGTSKIGTLTLEGANGASKWMYAIVVRDSTVPVPKLDRVYTNSNPYEAGQSIKVSVGDHLMILATDNSGKVRAYDTIKVEAGMVKNPLATELKETTHYTKLVKGGSIGSTKFDFLNHNEIKSWIYRVDDTVIDAPELGSTTTGAAITLTNTVSGNISVEADLTKLKADIFRKYMMIYGLDSKGKVQVYKNFTMNDTNVRMPNAEGLEKPTHYSEPKKGNSANTTRIENLAYTSLPGSNLKFKYKVVNEPISTMEFNHIIEGTSDLRANVDISVTVGNHLLLLVVDGSNKTKAFTTIPLTFDNVKAGNAKLLDLTTNYVGPVPGTDYNSTKFTFLNEDSKFVYKLGDTSFGIPESGSVVEGGTVVEPGSNITPVAANKYLLLLAVKEEDTKDKVIAYREFRLLDNQIKGGNGTVLVPGAYGLMKGDQPSTTKLKLEPLGLENPTSIIWRYKLVSDKTYKPYFNEIVEGTTIYTVNSTTKVGPDISVVKKADNDYGKILILATDSSGRTKAYGYADITSTDVKEHAPEGELSIGIGTQIDSVKFTGLTGSYKYLISDTRPETPAKGDNPPVGAIVYDGNDIQILIGKHISLYKIDGDGKVSEFNSFEVGEVAKGTAKLEIDSPGSLDLLEGNIVKGGTMLTITLTAPANAKWISDVVGNKSIRDKIFNGFKADSEAGEWAKVVSAMVADGNGAISLDGTGKIITLYLPKTSSYDITKDQTINLTIPHEAMEGAKNPIKVEEKITIKPTVGATISGNVVDSIVREVDIIAGGKTIVITLADGTWAGNVNDIINKFASDRSVGSNWDAIVTKIKEDPNKYINRDNGSTVTITLPPMPTGIAFNTGPEVVSLKIVTPSPLIPSATEDVVANPDFTLYPNRIKVEGKVLDANREVMLQAPDYKIVDTIQHTWIIEVKTGSLKDGITAKDLTISNLPRGLVANITQGKSDDNKDIILIKLTGTTSSTVANNTGVTIKINGSAVTEPNAEDSDEIEVKLVQGISIMEELKKVGIDIAGRLLTNTSEKMEYSLNSTNGTTNGTWNPASQNNTVINVSDEFKPGRVYVKEGTNPRVYHLVTTIPNYAKAPAGVSIAEVNYSTPIKVKLTLPNDDGTNYEYSTSDDMDWTTISSNTQVELQSDSDLRVRLKATETTLPSLPTNKINVLDLSGVKMDVGEGKITGTTAQMQYSLDGESYVNAKAGDTTGLKFAVGQEVLIRERTSIGNKRGLGTVAKKPNPSAASIEFHIPSGTITPADGMLQYKFVESDPWKDLDSDTKIDFKPGQLQFRAKGSESHLPSDSVTDDKFKISEPMSGPELRVIDASKDIQYWDNSVEEWKLLKDIEILEYKIDGDWKNSSEWKAGLAGNGSTKVSVRYKATASKLSSNITTVSFTADLDLDNVKLNVVEGKIEGTTTAMQYSTNGGLNGTWLDAKKDSTLLTFVEGMIVHVREIAKPHNSKVFEEIQVEVAISKSDISYDILGESISNKTTKILEYKLASEKWNILDRTVSIFGIKFVPGTLQFRVKGTETTLPSTIITENIKAKASKPELKYDDVDYEIIGIDKILDGKPLYEYNINGGTWIDGNNTSINFEGGNLVLVRLKATEKTLSSEEQEIKFTPNLDLTNVIFNAGKSQLENVSNQMEYRISSSIDDEEEGTWQLITKNPTPLKLGKDMYVYIRDKDKPRRNKLVTEEPIGKKDPILAKFDYNILQGTISFTSNNIDDDQKVINDLQYRINNHIDTNNWIDIDYVTLKPGINVLAYNVNFIPGDLEFRLKGDVKNLPSDPSTHEKSIKSPASAPNVSKGFDKDKYRNKINENTSSIEYRFGDSGSWIDGVHLKDENLVDIISFRTKAGTYSLPSLEKKLDFTPVLNLKTINLSTHVDPHELNGTNTQMEYNIYLKDTSTGWITCTVDNTIMPDWLDGNIKIDNLMKIEIRDKKQIENVVSVPLP